MADIKALLKINDVGNGEMIAFTTNVNSNNLSLKSNSNSFKDVIDSFSDENVNYGGAVGTPLGITTIANMRFGVENSNGVRSDNYLGIDLGYTDANSQKSVILTIEGQDLISFAIHFDQLRGQYPTDYSWVDINGNTHYVTGNTSNVISFEQDAGYGQIIITFNDWSLPNTSIGITYVEDIEIDIKLNKQWIIDFETQQQLTPDASQINYNVIANTGAINLKDIDNTLYRRASRGHLNTYIFTLELYINNNLLDSHITNQSPFYASNNTMQLQLTNMLDRWNKIIVPEKTYNYTSTYTIMLDVLEYCYPDKTRAQIQATQDSYLWDEYVTNTLTLRDVLTGTVTNGFTLKEGTALEQLNKICQATQIYGILLPNGNLRFFSARPILCSKQKQRLGVYSIPFKHQTKVLDYDILVANRYEEVEFK